LALQVEEVVDIVESIVDPKFVRQFTDEREETMRQVKHAAAAIALMGALAGCGNNDDPTGTAPVADDDDKTTSSESESDCQPVGYERDELLAPGCWAIQVRGLSGGPLAELELPAGFAGNDAWVWVNADEDEWGAITLMVVGDVYSDPCVRAGNPPELGPTVEDFAAALVSQKVTSTTTPVPVALDGHDGLYVELSVPADFDTSRCRDNELVIWEPVGEESAGADTWFVSRYWVLDVDGQRVVLVANTNTRATAETVELFTGIAESATFDQG
jgi:hypothetical protein